MNSPHESARKRGVLPRPSRAVVLFPTKRNSDQKDVPTSAEEFAGAKLWHCHGCGEPMGGEAPTLVPSMRHGYSHDIYHGRCATMPMKSKKQRAFLHAKKPDVAKRFEAETPKGAKLPKKAKRKDSK